ncbi:putative MerR family transcriptional regulator [Gordonia araii NBRC 100433]|uniref:Putative MerR family transcriptional regulator n=1 Tax=Gordonia araii NBRC 100433 TaxID=1073574 RepID=G7H0Y5_9ACTN|nr:MerR family transcriptional regulator [Gordonia araii]NNG97305.1 MerR family transcriptional regulator [Gordonia araii NBRC 100433]GAB09510.1 putative MerR family transcriptional regulator [Gordonia araii NBRC 100433]
MTEYRIDDLAREAGTTTRNVRGYQDRGLLPRPVRRGRIAIYSDVHLERLRVINNLLRRGFTTRHIADFFTGIQRGDGLADVLGLEDVVTKPWSSAHTTTMSAADLKTLLNTANPRHLARLAEYGLIAEVEGSAKPKRYRVLDTETVEAYSRLVKLGVPLDGILDVHGRVAEKMVGVAGSLISSGRRVIADQYHDGWIPETDDENAWATELLRELRKAGMVSAHNMLNRELDRTTSEQLAEYLGDAENVRDAGKKPHPA